MLRTLGTYLTGNLAEALLHLGEWERARALVGSALEGRPEGIFEATAQVLRAELAALCGDYAESREALVRTAAMVTDPNDDQFTAPLATIDADLHRAAGDYQRGPRHRARCARRKDRAPVGALPVAAGVDGRARRRRADRWPTPAWAWSCIPSSSSSSRRMPSARSDPRRLPRDVRRRARPASTGDAEWAPAVAAWRALEWPWPLAYSLLKDAEQHASRRSAARVVDDRAPARGSTAARRGRATRPALAHRLRRLVAMPEAATRSPS